MMEYKNDLRSKENFILYWGQTEMKPDLTSENKFHLSPVKS